MDCHSKTLPLVSILVLTSLLFALNAPANESANETDKQFYKPATGVKVNFNRQNAESSLKDLLDVAIASAKRQIDAYGSFSPFGIVITNKGTYQVIVGNGKDSGKDLTMIKQTYRRKALTRTIVAAAIVYNSSVDMPDKKNIDAIYINADSIYTGPRNGFQAYAKSDDGKYRYEKLIKLDEDKTRIFQ